MGNSDKTEHFVTRLTENQNRIYGYIFSLLGDHARAADVLQETNLVLWRKLEEFEVARPFLPWAFAIARFQVMAQLRDQKRDRLLLDDQLAEKLCEEVATQSEQLEAIQEALRPCLALLTATNRSLVNRKYFKSKSISEIAEEAGRTVGSIKVALVRIRRQLAECVEKRLNSEVAN